MKRLIIEGDWQERDEDLGADHRWVLNADGGSMVCLYVNDPSIKFTVEDIPDPLPTEPGAVIEATVYGRRNRLVLEQGVPPYRWRTLLDDENLSRALFEPAEITDWKLLLPGVTP